MSVIFFKFQSCLLVINGFFKLIAKKRPLQVAIYLAWQLYINFTKFYNPVGHFHSF